MWTLQDDGGMLGDFGVFVLSEMASKMPHIQQGPSAL
jgi:hypothetical protein